MEKEGTGGGENGEGRGEKVEGGCCEGGGCDGKRCILANPTHTLKEYLIHFVKLKNGKIIRVAFIRYYIIICVLYNVYTNYLCTAHLESAGYYFFLRDKYLTLIS